MHKPGMVVEFTAKAAEAEAFAQILDDALSLVKPGPGTTPWMGVRAVDDPNTFFVVNLYADHAALERHVNGPAAALVLGEGREHLVADPEIATVKQACSQARTSRRLRSPDHPAHRQPRDGSARALRARRARADHGDAPPAHAPP